MFELIAVRLIESRMRNDITKYIQDEFKVFRVDVTLCKGESHGFFVMVDTAIPQH
jgi:hypothetical protein